MFRPLMAIAAAAIAATPAAAATYSAKLIAPANQRVVTRDIVWYCGPAACQGASEDSRPAVLCWSLAKRVGRIERFIVNGHAFGAADLARCDAAAKPPPLRGSPLPVESAATAVTEISNRQLIDAVMTALTGGDGAPFVSLMAEDFEWIIEGTTPWSGTYRGKDVVRERLLGPLFGQFASRYRNTAERILCDGNYVVVQCAGDVQTRTGKRYDNHYCYVIRMIDGQMIELREYLDTALVEAALEPPARP